MDKFCYIWEYFLESNKRRDSDLVKRCSFKLIDMTEKRAYKQLC